LSLSPLFAVAVLAVAALGAAVLPAATLGTADPPVAAFRAAGLLAAGCRIARPGGVGPAVVDPEAPPSLRSGPPCPSVFLAVVVIVDNTRLDH